MTSRQALAKEAASAADYFEAYACDYNDPDADITLLSDDRLRFRVHSYHLRSQSAVFRDLLSHKQDADASVKPIDIDADCHAVRVFLDLMWKAADEVVSNPDAWTNKTVLDLAIKFEAPVVRERAIRRFDMLAVQKPWDTFCVASYMLGGDVELAKKAIKHIAIGDITINTPHQIRERLMKRPLAHALSVHEAAKCSLPFLIGLYRACGVDVFENLDWENVAQQFIPATAQGEAGSSLIQHAKS